MAVQSMTLDPNAGSYTDDEIVAKVNNATDVITRAGAVDPAARPIEPGEVGTNEIADGAVTQAELGVGAAKANLDAMTDTTRGYVKTSPIATQFKIIAIERDETGKLKVDYDDVAV